MQEIKENLLKDLNDLMRKFVSLKAEDFKEHYHMAKVIDNSGDPDKLGRIKIMVYGLMDKIPEGDLPWATPLQGLGGSLIVPKVGALVQIYFQDEDLNNPFYTCVISNRNNTPDELSEDYPDTMVLLSNDDGMKMTYNRKSFEFVFRHSSGTIFTINSLGNLDLDTTSSNIGNINITARGKLNVDAPIIEFPVGTISPGLGPFNCLPLDPITGVQHQGNIEIRT